MAAIKAAIARPWKGEDDASRRLSPFFCSGEDAGPPSVSSDAHCRWCIAARRFPKEIFLLFEIYSGKDRVSSEKNPCQRALKVFFEDGMKILPIEDS